MRAASIVQVLAIGIVLARGQCAASETKPFTIADSIALAVVGDPGESAARFPLYSEDGRKFLVLTHRGDVESNTNLYSLLLFQEPAPGSDKLVPIVLFEARTKSSQAAVSYVRWSADGNSVSFIGEDVRGRRHIYVVDVVSRKSRIVVQHGTPILGYAIAQNESAALFFARPPERELISRTQREHGLVVQGQDLATLVRQREIVPERYGRFSDQLWLKRKSRREQEIALAPGETPVRISISPRGTHAVVTSFVQVDHLPSQWLAYRLHPSQTAAIAYRLVDLRSGQSKWLIDAPSDVRRGATDVVWLKDGASVVLPASFWPATVPEAPRDSELGQLNSAVEIAIDDGRITRIADGVFKIRSWDGVTSSLRLSKIDTRSGREDVAQAFQKSNGVWQEIGPSTISSSESSRVRLEEGINRPQRLVVGSGSAAHTVYDFNPQISQLQIAHVELVEVTLSNGKVVRGGLYMPLSRGSDSRLPLVVQTHGFDIHRFAVDGDSSAGYAAQALASANVAVVQLPFASLEPDDEVRLNAEMIERVIEQLDNRGLIDIDRLGVQAWSRSGAAVRHLLVKSKYKFRAALLADSLEAGYWQYIAGATRDPKSARFYEILNGGAVPTGDGIDVWKANAPNFNLGKVTAAVRVVLFGPDSILTGWETFSMLRRLGRPAELLWLPDAAHDPVRPSERLAAQQGAVDWFGFWLNGYEDKSPEKRIQYARWRALQSAKQAMVSPAPSDTPH